MTGMQTLGQRIRAAREEIGLTQEDVARAINVTAQTPSRWERDRNVPYPRQIRAMADLFGKPADHFQEAPVASPDLLAQQVLARLQEALLGDKRENAVRWDRRHRQQPYDVEKRGAAVTA